MRTHIFSAGLALALLALPALVVQELVDPFVFRDECHRRIMVRSSIEPSPA